jgi:ubiquinone/menaquinone biosynthesis C-methylase UbiE
MLLNRVEKSLMNNPVRAAIQRRFEVPRLLELGGRMRGGVALEIGCGRGVGTELILDVCGADRVDAFDLDPDMVSQAQRRLRRFGDRVRLWVGDVTAIDAPTGAYDAVFDFGVIHHVPAWRDALREIRRVLRPGGRLYAEEVLAKLILHPVWRRVLDHPLHDRFDHDTFQRTLADEGFDVVATRQLLGDFGWYVADRRAG